MNIKPTLSAILVALSTTGADAATIVSPSNLTASEGSASGGIPFITNPKRLQQVFSASEFSSLGSSLSLTAIAFRPDSASSFTGAFSISDFQVDLSTTTKNSDALNTSSFAANTGTDVSQVFRGTVTQTIANTMSNGVTRDFELLITFSTPFVYNPAAGNLLMDLKNLSGNSGSAPQLDFQSVSGDAISIVGNNGSATGDTVAFSDTGGLVTRFTYTVVPEPSAALLAALGIGCAFLRRFRDGSYA